MKSFIKFIPIFLLTSIIYGVQAMAATDIYTVESGDSLWEISEKYQVGLPEIITANPQLSNPNLIYPGDKIYVPLVDSDILSLEAQVVELVNKERAKVQVKPLKANWEVSRVARLKSQDMRDNGYFAYESPDNVTSSEMLKDNNIEFTTSGENIAMGHTSAESVVETWLNSEEYRRNILDASFREIGVGYAKEGDMTFWTQIFIGNL